MRNRRLCRFPQIAGYDPEGCNLFRTTDSGYVLEEGQREIDRLTSESIRSSLHSS